MPNTNFFKGGGAVEKQMRYPDTLGLGLHRPLDKITILDKIKTLDNIIILDNIKMLDKNTILDNIKI